MDAIPPRRRGTLSRDWTIRLVIAALSSVMAAILGPFTTYEVFSFPMRLLYASGVIFAVMFPAIYIRDLVLAHTRLPLLQQGLITAVLQTLLLCPLVWLFSAFIVGLDIANPLAFVELFSIALVIFLMPVAVRAMLAEDEGTPLSLEDAQASPRDMDLPFLRRLEASKRGALMRVSADGHQLIVCTDQGESRIRMRFSDALEELESANGVCIHRSHWVAVDQIVSVAVEGRRHKVHLACGNQLPVSSTGVKTLKQAGVSFL